MKAINASVMSSNRRSLLAFSDSLYYKSLAGLIDATEERKQTDTISQKSHKFQQSKDSFVDDSNLKYISRPNTLTFPYTKREPLPPLLDIQNFILESIEPPENIQMDMLPSISSASKWKRSSMNTSEILASVDFIKTNLTELVEKIMDNRQLSRDIGEYIIHLYPPLSPEITENVLNEGLIHLKHYQEEIIGYKTELERIKTNRLEEVFSGYESSSVKDYLGQLRGALIKLTDSIHNETLITLSMIDNLNSIIYELLSLPKGLSNRVDGIQVDFKENMSIANQFTMSKRCRRYLIYNQSRSIPICPAVYTFLQSSTNFSKILNLHSYQFASEEFNALINFFTRFKLQNMIEQLVLDESNISERDVHSLCTKFISQCKSLKVLSLRSLNLSTSSAISIAICAWDGGLRQLRILRLDSNDIKYEGVKLLSTSLQRCRYIESLSISSNPIGDWGVYHILKSILNRHRWMYSKYPKPSRIKALRSDDQSLDTVQSSLRLPFTQYPPRSSTFRILSTLSKFTYIILPENQYLYINENSNNNNTSGNNNNQNKFISKNVSKQTLISGSSNSMRETNETKDSKEKNTGQGQKQEQEQGEEEEYDDELAEDDDELMSITSQFLGSTSSQSSSNLFHNQTHNQSQSHSHNNYNHDYSHNRSDDNDTENENKYVILELFRSTKDRSKSSHGNSKHFNITGATSTKSESVINDKKRKELGKGDSGRNRSDRESDDEFSMSEEDPYSSSSDEDEEDDKEDDKEDGDNNNTSNNTKVTQLGTSEADTRFFDTNYKPFQSIMGSKTYTTKATGKNMKDTIAVVHGHYRYGRYNKIQKLFVKIQYRLFAVIAFRRLLRPGLSITSLNFSNCQLSSISSLLIRLALMDNSNVTELDLSRNPNLFSHPHILSHNHLSNHMFNNSSNGNNNTVITTIDPNDLISSQSYAPVLYQPMGDTASQFHLILTMSKIRHISLKNCGLLEEHMEILTQAMSKSKYLQSIELSDNHLGPTALNWITTTLGQYSIDVLDMTSGFQPTQTVKEFRGEDFGELLVDEVALERLNLNVSKSKSHGLVDNDNIDHYIKSNNIKAVDITSKKGSNRFTSKKGLNSPKSPKQVVINKKNDDNDDHNRNIKDRDHREESKEDRKFRLELLGKRYIKILSKRRDMDNISSRCNMISSEQDRVNSDDDDDNDG